MPGELWPWMNSRSPPCVSVGACQKWPKPMSYSVAADCALAAAVLLDRAQRIDPFDCFGGVEVAHRAHLPSPVCCRLVVHLPMRSALTYRNSHAISRGARAATQVIDLVEAALGAVPMSRR